ncbi:TPA: aminotransferase class III-fold pyridoxal phosphate-dependent enzyme, partial [Candidatus Poribacteria bacterium]|nr:aminotransferase class III-fold pyridoxal phosphate-dependent enzyme [Candidatus Poribacteria bacterium]
MASEDYSLLDMYENAFPNSRKLYQKASTLFPNGVTHDGRYLQPYPIYVERAKGSKKWDVDGREYIDYWSGHGALLLGHGREEVVKAVTEQVALGTHLGACHRKEVEWAELVIDMVPSAEKVRFTSSGTEATLMAIRLSRTFTGKNKLLKFAGHFHGWHDQVILGANPPYETPPPGIIKEVVDTTVIRPPNDIEAVEKTLQTDNDIAGVIIEPTGGGFGTIPTGGEFLKQLREVTSRYSVILIFDEVISGFRVAPGGAQEYYNVTPDLTTLAKILAGGLPGGAVAGRNDIMELLENRKDPEWKSNKKMPHPGTFNANP